MSSERSLHEKSMGLHPAPKVYVVDDDGSIRFAMQILMESNGIGVETFATAEAFLESFRPEYAGCLVLDIHMPGISGLDLQEILRQKEVSIPIIFFKKGAVDFIEKPFECKDLLERVREALRLDAESRQRKNECVSIAYRLASLTPRESEVMDRIIAGRLNKIIAEELHICIKTVEAHRAKVMEKMRVDSVAELVRITLGARGADIPPSPHHV
jgi:FixJ family two-component response regulator